MAGAGGSTKFYNTRALLKRFGPSFTCRQCDYICAILNEERGLDLPSRSQHTEDCKARFEKLTEEEDLFFLANTSSDDGDAHHCKHSFGSPSPLMITFRMIVMMQRSRTAIRNRWSMLNTYACRQEKSVSRSSGKEGALAVQKRHVQRNLQAVIGGHRIWLSLPAFQRKQDCYDDQPSPKRFCVDHCHKGLTGSPGSRAS